MLNPSESRSQHFQHIDIALKEGFCFKNPGNYCTFVFHKNGKSYSGSYVSKLWNKICGQVGVKINFYQGTRHSSITEAVERVSYDDVQEFVDHSGGK